MGTKSNPGEFDCYANAEPDEPLFVLRAKDPLAPALVRSWVSRRGDALGNKITDRDKRKLIEAAQCAEDMESWRRKNCPREPLKTSAELTDGQIRGSLGAIDCLGCGDKKQRRKSHCRACYFALPPELRSALYQKFGEGYEEAFRESIDYLRMTQTPV